MPAITTLLRDLVPIRPLTLPEAMRIAELQASHFIQQLALDGPPFPESAIAELPRVQVERMKLIGLSGATEWSHGRWLIVLNGSESATRQRFSLAHEYKHVLDHPFITVIYPPLHAATSEGRAEQMCDYFAGCLLMPRTWLKRAWGEGTQDANALARRFSVSRAAMNVRLFQIGILQPTDRHHPPTTGPGYRRLAGTKDDLACPA
ncbi:MAG: ImmA/IrrE family metallo-endopeptidase [Frankiaceae bacterium]